MLFANCLHMILLNHIRELYVKKGQKRTADENEDETGVDDSGFYYTSMITARKGEYCYASLEVFLHDRNLEEIYNATKPTTAI